MKMKEVLCVPCLKKNIISISTLYEKGYRVSFIDGQLLMWPKGKSIEDAVVIDEKKEAYINSRGIQKQPLFMRPLAQVNYGIGGLLTSTTKHYPM